MELGDNLASFCDLAIFLAKKECSRNLNSRACNINRKRDLPEFFRWLAKLEILYAKLNYKYPHFTFSFSFSILTATSAFGRLNSCVCLLLFEVLRQIIFLCLVFFWICCTTLSVGSIFVNYLLLKVLARPRNFFC